MENVHTLSHAEIGHLMVETAQPDVPREGDLPSKRFRYDALQEIGPCIDEAPPDPDDFFAVKCYDLSTGGISLLMHDPPNWTTAVITLGNTPLRQFMLAEVRVTRLVTTQEGERQLVGCRFVRRIESGPFESVRMHGPANDRTAVAS